MLKFKEISFPDSGEGATALVEVVDGKDKFVMYGDEYHDKISDRIEGFFEGLEHASVEYEVEEVELEDTDMYTYFE